MSNTEAHINAAHLVIEVINKEMKHQPNLYRQTYLQERKEKWQKKLNSYQSELSSNF